MPARTRSLSSRALTPLCVALWGLPAASAVLAQVGAAKRGPAVQASAPQRYIVALRVDAHAARTQGPAEREAMQQDMQRSLAAWGAGRARLLKKQPALVAELSESQAEQLRQDPRVAFVERDLLRHIATIAPEAPSPEAAASKFMNGFTGASKAPFALGQRISYGMRNSQALRVPPTPAAGEPSFTVCIIDSGYDRTHPDLAGNPVTGSHDSKAGWWYSDDMGHGSHVSGILAGMNNASGVVGVLPHGRIKLHMVKVFGHEEWTYSADLIDAVDECVDAGAKVINMSLAGEGHSAAEQAAFQAVADGGVLMVAAAGNLGNGSIAYPAAYPSVVAVAATDLWNKRASYSQRNSTIEWAAPGSDVLSSVPMGKAGEPSLAVDGKALASPRWVLGSKTNLSVTGELADFKDGRKVDKAMAGKICVATHNPDQPDISTINANCERSKGVGVIVGNEREGSQYAYITPMDGSPYLKLPVVTASFKQMQALKTQFGKSATLTLKPTNYAYYNGTSMATPYAAGIAALLWSHFPACTAQHIRAAIGATAKDLGAPGRDNDFGLGLVQGKAAFDRLKAEGCGA